MSPLGTWALAAALSALPPEIPSRIPGPQSLWILSKSSPLKKKKLFIHLRKKEHEQGGQGDRDSLTRGSLP